MRLFVPRISIDATTSAVAALSCSDSKSPVRRVSTAETASPRLFFGSRASCMPLSRVASEVRVAMFAGDGSKASPAVMASRPV